MTSASLPPVSLIRCLTHSSIVPMLPAWTPQSMRMCCRPCFFVGTVRRKKSPKPIRYMRTRMEPSDLPPPAGRWPLEGAAGRLPAADLVADLLAFVPVLRPADAALRVVFFAALFVAFLADFLADFFAAFFALFFVVFFVGIIRIPGAAVRS